MDTNFLIAGVDEAGCGPLAGPVIAAAVILNPNYPLDGLDDSKKLSPKRREVLSALIKEHSIAWAIGRAEAHEIDKINILQAALLAMQRAIISLSIKPQQLLIDGLRCPPQLAGKYSMRAIIGGDSLVPEISAASIIAKVTRDHEMMEYDKQYPEYGFAKHKGYGTKEHLAAIKKHGICNIHRKSFAPCAHASEK